MWEVLLGFADGDQVVPVHISTGLIEVTTGRQHNLFRVARLLWSLPFSKGVGRRLRFLIFDRANGKLIGLLARQSWRERWLLPRAQRVDGWRKWRKETIRNLLLLPT